MGTRIGGNEGLGNKEHGVGELRMGFCGMGIGDGGNTESTASPLLCFALTLKLFGFCAVFFFGFFLVFFVVDFYAAIRHKYFLST